MSRVTRAALRAQATVPLVSSAGAGGRKSKQQSKPGSHVAPPPKQPRVSEQSPACSSTVPDVEDAVGDAEWERHVHNIRLMRTKRDAPVDTMGCEKLFDPDAEQRVQHFQILVSLLLSSQTKDEVTSAAVGRLRQFGCTPEHIGLADVDQLRHIIYPVGFYKKKAEMLKRTSAVIVAEHDGVVPATVAELCALPGIGPKMAHLHMLVAHRQSTGIAVDTHVHRIANRLKWTKKERTNPEDTRADLEALFPKDLWAEINLLVVGFGQQVCFAKQPKCAECLNNRLCATGRQSIVKDE